MNDVNIYFSALSVGMAGFLLLWPLSLALRDSSLVDLWWGPGVLASLIAFLALKAGEDERSLLILLLIAAWSLRLGFTMARRRLRHGGEDPRYGELRNRFGGGFWWKSLFVVFMLQVFLQSLIALPALAASHSPMLDFGFMGISGVALASAGFALEAIGDAQLDRFKSSAAKGTLLTTGLRAHIRYPSYLGEMMFWWGLWLIAAEAGAWWSVISPMLVTFLLIKVSGAALSDERLSWSRPEYQAWAARTPAFLPRFRHPR